jgi:hypothetical protein
MTLTETSNVMVIGQCNVNQKLRMHLRNCKSSCGIEYFRKDKPVVVAKIAVPGNITISYLQALNINLIFKDLTYICKKVFVDRNNRVFMYLKLVNDSMFQNANINDILYEVCVLNSSCDADMLVQELESKTFEVCIRDLMFHGVSVGRLA